VSKKEPSNNCRYCGSEITPSIAKCKHCGEWLQWTWKNDLKIYLEQAGRLVVVISLILAVIQMRKTRSLEEVSAVSSVQSRYMEIDRLLFERPEYTSLVVPVEDYESTVKMTGNREGLRRLQEGQFIAYVLDAYEMEFYLRDTYGLYPKGTEFVLEKFITNPRVLDWWYNENLRQWYSEDFRAYLEAKMPKAPGK
jgi:hypothetical protein